MALGTTGFRAAKGDLVKVKTDRYPSIPKGTVANVETVSESGSQCTVDCCAGVSIALVDLEIISYKRCCNAKMAPRQLR